MKVIYEFNTSNEDDVEDLKIFRQTKEMYFALNHMNNISTKRKTVNTSPEFEQ